MIDAAMVSVYLALIRAGRRTLDQVPANLRAAVGEALNAPTE